MEKSDLKILLLHPIVPFRVLWGKFHRGGGFVPPIGMLSIAAYIREKGYSVEILDTGVEGIQDGELEKHLKAGNYDVVGMPCFTNTAAYTFKTADIVRKALPGSLIVLGGVHATVLPEKTMSECPAADMVVIGEGEITFLGILDWRSNRGARLEDIDGIAYKDGTSVKMTRPRQPIADLDILPMPAYDLLKLDKYFPHSTQYKRLPSYPLLTTRGCPYQCTFCSASKIHGRKLRMKSLDKIFEEMDYLIREHGARGFFIQDSSFLISRKYVVKFCERLIKGKYDLSWMCNARVDQIDEELAALMKKAGCWQIVFGVESANESSLKLMKKNQTPAQAVRAVNAVKKAGIQVYASYILGFPGETSREVENTIDFARKLATHTAIFYLPVPFPGTELLEQCRIDGGLRQGVAWDDYTSTDFSNPIYVNPQLGKERLLKYYKKAYLKFYTSPKVIMANLTSIRSVDDIKYYWRAAGALLGLSE